LRIRDLYDRPVPTISFEYFPPRSAEAEEKLLRETTPGLKALGPAFISVTYGAGGSTRDNTLRIVNSIRRDHGIDAMPHLTCVGHTQADLLGIMKEAEAAGIENVLALRGDPPKGQAEFQAAEGGFRYAVDLIRFLKGLNTPFCVGAACYPEGHIESAHKHDDWDVSAAKVEAGAEFLITQLFYDWSHFLDMEDYLRNKRGVKVPIIPGILPFLGAEQIKRFTSLCGARLPQPIVRKLEQYGSDDESVRKLGVEVCTEVCARLLPRVAGFHFYCLNRVQSCAEVVRNLGLAR
jgi:methylenetetrahydrofolate reductase (NADPH)